MPLPTSARSSSEVTNLTSSSELVCPSMRRALVRVIAEPVSCRLPPTSITPHSFSKTNSICLDFNPTNIPLRISSYEMVHSSQPRALDLSSKFVYCCCCLRSIFNRWTCVFCITNREPAVGFPNCNYDAMKVETSAILIDWICCCDHHC
jgi:hypothetical protein